MADVRILHGGGVGSYKKGDIVKDAPPGLLEIAKAQLRNAADGEIVAELVEVDDAEMVALRERANELGVKGNIGAMKRATLEAKIAEAEELLKQAGAQ